MGLDISHTEDGATVFSCSRTRPDAQDELGRWIGEEAVRQGRCSLCLYPLSEGCGGPGECSKPPTHDAAAVAILRGMVRG